MQDLESSQLLLFIQSFGIPTASMGKLLRYLDRSVAVDSGAIQQLVVDKDYMIQLIDIEVLLDVTTLGRSYPGHTALSECWVVSTTSVVENRQTAP